MFHKLRFEGEESNGEKPGAKDYRTAIRAFQMLTDPDQIKRFVKEMTAYIQALEQYGEVDTSTPEKAQELVRINLNHLFGGYDPKNKPAWKEAIAELLEAGE